MGIYSIYPKYVMVIHGRCMCIYVPQHYRWSGALFKNRSLGSVLIWWHRIAILNVVFEKVFVLKRLRYIVRSERVTEHKNVVITNIQMQMICDIPVLFGKWNSHPISYTHHTWQQVSHSWDTDTLCQSIRKLSTSGCHHLNRNTCSTDIKKHNFQDHYVNYVSFSFFQDHFLVQ